MKKEALVEPRMLQWARESTLLTLDEAAKKAQVSVDRLADAERGAGSITFRQLERLAYACRIPLHTLYLPEPPHEESLPIDFRSHKQGGGHFSPSLIKILRVARERRDTVLELFGDLDIRSTELPALRTDAAIVSAMRPLMCVLDWNTVVPKKELWRGSKALSLTKEIVETRLPVLIFEFIVDPKDLRGCSVFGEKLSIIALSTRDNPNARRFTIAHELAHLMMRQSGLCVPIRGRISDETERRCNLIAGEALLPTDHLRRDVQEKKSVGTDSLIEYLAKRYCLSYSATAVRLNQFGRLTSTELQERLDLYADSYSREREQQAESENGPNYHLLQVQRLGPTFTNVVLSGIESDHLSLSQAAHLLQVSASYDNVTKLREKAMSVYGSR